MHPDLSPTGPTPEEPPTGPACPERRSDDIVPPARYEILGRLGRGGGGIVFRALDKVLGRQVALKFLLRTHPDHLRELHVEARAQARLEHPNICRVYEVGEHEGRGYIAMQLVEGDPIHLAALHVPLETRVVWMRKVAEAVHAAHREGLVHRDIKPTNIMVTRGTEGEQEPVLLDFGLAYDLTQQETTDSGAVVGTPAYMSPEQLQGDLASLDRRTDLWSLGLTFRQMLTDEQPYVGVPGLGALLERQRMGLVPMRTLHPGIPRDLETVIGTCLRLDREDRYPTARALAEDLQRVLEGTPILARPAGPLDRLGKWIRRNRALSAALGVVLALVLGSLGYVALLRGQVQQAFRFSLEVQASEVLLASLQGLPEGPAGAGIQEVRRRLEVLETRAAGLPRRARGSALAFCGRLRRILGDLEQARTHYEASRELGGLVAPAQADYSLALLGLHQARLRRREGPDWDPRPEARRLLKRHGEQARIPEEARVALLVLDGREAEAFQALAAGIAAAPWRMDLRLMEGRLRVDALEAHRAWSTPLQAQLEEAETHLATLAQLLPGDPVVPLLRARLALLRVRRLGQGGLEAAQSQVSHALALDPAMDAARELASEVLLERLARGDRAVGADLEALWAACREPREWLRMHQNWRRSLVLTSNS